MFGLTQTSASYLAVVGLTGTLIGSIFWGFMADRSGRRVVLLWTVGIFSAASLCGLAMEYWHSFIACTIMGFGVGGEAPLVFAIAAEYIPARFRGRTILFLGIVRSTLGYALATATSAVAKAFFPETFAWRILWLVGVIPAAMVVVLRSRVIPESARYLLARGRVAEARAAAESLVGPIAAVKVVQAKRDELACAQTSPNLYGRTAVLGLFSFGWGLANFGFITWLPTLLKQLGYTSSTSSGYLAL